MLALADDPVGFPVAAAQFHLQVVERAGNRTLALFGRIMLDIVETHNRAIFSVRPADDGQVERANQEHADLLSHVEAHDGAAAVACWERHLTNATRFALETLGANTTINLAETVPQERF